MNIIREISNNTFVKGRSVVKCPSCEFVLINEATIRKEPSSISDPDIIKLLDENSNLIGIYKRINTDVEAESGCIDSVSKNSYVTLWGKVS